MTGRDVFFILLFGIGSIYLVYDNFKLYRKVQHSEDQALIRERMKSNYFLLIILIVSLCERFENIL